MTKVMNHKMDHDHARLRQNRVSRLDIVQNACHGEGTCNTACKFDLVQDLTQFTSYYPRSTIPQTEQRTQIPVAPHIPHCIKGDIPLSIAEQSLGNRCASPFVMLYNVLV